jgi:arabinose-5-phosphate isomerase
VESDFELADFIHAMSDGEPVSTFPDIALKRAKQRGGHRSAKGRDFSVATTLSRKNAVATAASLANPPVASARRTIDTERTGLSALLAELDNGLAEPFAAAVETISKATGRVAVTGIGKSGHIARKVAATLASTGTQALFVHPAEASHGDLGMVAKDGVVLALSWSGETAELRSLVEYSRRFAIPLIAVTARPESTLARRSDIVLTLPKAEEACPHGLAPTTSTLMQLALGDALAIALLEARGFTADDFREIHPGGQLGASLRLVREIMHVGVAIPLARLGTGMDAAILAMTEKGFGCLGIADADDSLVGIITDGDLRRHLGPDLLSQKVDDVMTRGPKTIPPDMLCGAALELLNHAKITTLFVVEDAKPVGIVHLHDFLRAGVA